MAIDDALLRQVQLGRGPGRAFLRLYRWSPPCLSFGRNEPACTRYDAAAIHRLGLETVRRPTGGRAVWHDDELTYAVVAPIAVFGSLAASYTEIHHVLAAALRQMGVAADLAPHRNGRTAPLSSGACFAAPVGGEVVARGAKLIGSAQVREGHALLQHGSLLLTNRQDVVSRVTRNAGAVVMATSLSEIMRRPMAFEDVAPAVIREAQHTWSGTWTTGAAPTQCGGNAKYADPAWTWRR